MVKQPQFDVLLAYNSQDEHQVIYIAEKLRQHGIKPWVEAERVLPGSWYQDVFQKAILDVQSTAIFIGQGLDNWQTIKLQVLIRQSVEAKRPLIPILLPDAQGIPEDWLFAQEIKWIRFVNGIDDVKALDNLVRGITEYKKESPPPTSVERQFQCIFLYNEQDLHEVLKVWQQLDKQHIRPWMDILSGAGLPWQQLLQEQITLVKSVVVFIGSNGGPWQQNIIDCFLWEFTDLNCPVIPVILQNVLQEPKLPIYLKRRTRVDFRYKNPDPMQQLIKGIPKVN